LNPNMSIGASAKDQKWLDEVDVNIPRDEGLDEGRYVGEINETELSRARSIKRSGTSSDPDPADSSSDQDQGRLEHQTTREEKDSSVYRSERPLAGWDDAAIYRRDGRNDLDISATMSLNNYLQKRYKRTDILTWKVIQIGPAHSCYWKVIASINDFEYGRATEASRNAAREAAAHNVLLALRGY